MGLVKSYKAKDIRLALFLDDFAGEVLRLIVHAWEKMQIPSEVNMENRITALLRDKIKECCNPDFIHFVSMVEQITDSDDGTELGRNDLLFYPVRHQRQTIFFTVECKRLHTPTATLIGEYVKEGMMRFLIEGNPKQYSRNLPCGAMVGYVLDGDTPKAFASVCKKITEHKSALRIFSENAFQTPSRHLKNYTFSADTYHTRENKSFSLHHVLLPSHRK
jgi:hypothetical protein